MTSLKSNIDYYRGIESRASNKFNTVTEYLQDMKYTHDNITIVLTFISYKNSSYFLLFETYIFFLRVFI